MAARKPSMKPKKRAKTRGGSKTGTPRVSVPGGRGWRKYFTPRELKQWKRLPKAERESIAELLTAIPEPKPRKPTKPKPKREKARYSPKWDASLADAAHKRDRVFGEVSIPPGESEPWAVDAENACAMLERLMHDAIAKWPDVELWAGGFRYKTSASDNDDGEPIWEEADFYWQTTFPRPDHPDPLGHSLESAKSAIRDFSVGNRRTDNRQHYYRIWIVAVNVFGMSKKGGFDVTDKTSSKKRHSRRRSV